MTHHKTRRLAALLGAAVVALIAAPTSALAAPTDPPNTAPTTVASSDPAATPSDPTATSPLAPAVTLPPEASESTGAPTGDTAPVQPLAGGLLGASTPKCTTDATGKVTVDPSSATYANLMAAMHGEAFAYVSYHDYADIARAAGLTDIATLFGDTADYEWEDHFSVEAGFANLVKSDDENLATAIAGETNETDNMYPNFATAAYAAGDKNAGDLFTDIGGDEAIHAAAYQDAQAALTNGVEDPTKVPAGQTPASISFVLNPAALPSATTLANLSYAMHGEAFAHVSYMMYSEAAKANGNQKIADLFAATAAVERYEHFREEGNMAGQYGDTAANLRTAIAGETYEATSMYPGFAATATAEGCDAVAAEFTQIGKDEAQHAAQFAAALKPLVPPACTTDAATGKVTVNPSSQTYANLMAAMHGEAFAYATYTDYAAIAATEGWPEVAKLFTDTADYERVDHFTTEAGFVNLVKSTAENLQTANAGETNETTAMYPNFATAAYAAGDKNAGDLFTDIGGDEAKHAADYATAEKSLTDTKVAVPLGQALVNIPLVPGGPKVKGTDTLANLSYAMHGESFAYLSYMMYSDAAKTAGNTAVGNLFAKTAQIERYEHFREEAALAGQFGDTAQNLQTAIAGETYENTSMYPGFAAIATAEGCDAVAAELMAIATDEGRHAGEFSDALKTVQATAPATPACTVDANGVTTVSPTSQTYANLMAAMHGEAYAYASYTDFAIVAAKAGLTDVAKLFTTTGPVEKDEHFAEEAAFAGLVGSDKDNLRAGIAGETTENTRMYPQFALDATGTGDANAATLFGEIGGDEGIHAGTYLDALNSLDANGKENKAMVPGGQVAKIWTVAPQAVQVKDPTTVRNLDYAMHGEAFAYASYMLYSAAAATNGNTAIAGLFEATAKVERYEHFREEAAMSGHYGDTAANLRTAIAGETYEYTSMYPGFAATARAEGCLDVATRFDEIAGDEAKHADAFGKALTALTAPGKGSAKGLAVGTGGTVVTGGAGQSTSTAGLLAAAALLGLSLVLGRVWRRQRVTL